MRTKWVIDKAHSEIEFKVKHMMITTVTGHFNDFDAVAEADNDDFENTRITFDAAADSIDTNSEQRDTHLKSADFFDAEHYPRIKFESTEFRRIDNSHYKLTGNLTMRDITKPVSLDVEFAGIGKDPWGNVKAGFTVTGKINRKDWNLNWNAVLESGGMLVSDEVRVSSEVQFTKQQQAVAA
jgi:polyisoprenoid-binding protein YceI